MNDSFLLKVFFLGLILKGLMIFFLLIILNYKNIIFILGDFFDLLWEVMFGFKIFKIVGRLIL